ncbi:hypothetical protein [Pedobacter sp. UBA5917]|jgi:hypothetical protein|uniref:hypothetical protein n=1 Tax=Pedobacter sp. UBA5917 TaxID=1947061 RepID=UPI0025CCEE5A|nr:hypothetical protein [Pedobacter sp. UBA5917]
MVEKYTPAGHASAASVITTFAIGIVASLLLPLFYIILSQLIPNIWFIAICAFLLGMGLGLTINLGIKIGKIRNFQIALLIAIVCSLLAFYVQWVFFDAVMYSRRGFTFSQSSTDLKQLILDMGFLFVHPGILFKEIVALNEIGTFRIQGSSNISGILLWVIWMGEFLVIIGGTLLIVGNGQVKLPYSELNDQWMTPRKPGLLIPFVQDKEHLISQLNKRNFDALKNNPEVLREPEYGEVVIYEALGDPTKYISVLNVTAPSGRNKQAKKKTVLSHYPLPNHPAI